MAGFLLRMSRFLLRVVVAIANAKPHRGLNSSNLEHVACSIRALVRQNDVVHHEVPLHMTTERRNDVQEH